MDEAWFDCVEGAVKRALPANSRVAVDPALATDDVYWQRLNEFAFPRFRVVEAFEADWIVTAAVASPGFLSCGGLSITGLRNR
jgi:hypothetical protein